MFRNPKAIAVVDVAIRAASRSGGQREVAFVVKSVEVAGATAVLGHVSSGVIGEG